MCVTVHYCCVMASLYNMYCCSMTSLIPCTVSGNLCVWCAQWGVINYHGDITLIPCPLIWPMMGKLFYTQYNFTNAGLSDRYSRKYGLLISGLVFTIGSIILATSFHIWWVNYAYRRFCNPFILPHPFLCRTLYIGRCTCGFAIG